MWTLVASDFADDANVIGTLTHEWAHAIVGDWFEHHGVAGWTEEGLCEYLGHEAVVTLGRQRTAVVGHRRRELRSALKRLDDVVDLWRFAALDRASFGAHVRSACGSDGYLGYSLGLAYWLSWDATARREMIRRLRSGELAWDRDLKRAMEELGPNGDLSFRAFRPAAALRVLDEESRRAASTDRRNTAGAS